MPNRIIKETIQTSKSVNLLTDFQFRVFIHLITYVDDYGRGSADPEIIKGRALTRRKNLTEKQIADALYAMANTGIINLYEVDGESFLYFPHWAKHQQVRNKVSKFPEPPAFDDTAESETSCTTQEQKSNLTSNDIKRYQAQADDCKCARNPIQSNPIQNPIQNPESVSCTEPHSGSAPTPEEPAIKLPLNDSTEYAVPQSFADEMAKLYPAVDVMQQLAAMRGWLIGNPTKRKTRAGIKRFITSWLAREQDRGRSTAQRQPYAQTQSKTALAGDASYDLEAFERMTLYGTGGGRG